MLNIQKNLSNRFYAILSLPATAMGFALSVQIAAMSWILQTQFGLDVHDIGFVWAAGPLAGIIGQVIVGAISDNVWFWGGRRRPFILIGGVLAALSLLALPNIDVISSSLGVEGIVGVAITVALVLDLSINVSFNPTRSIIADVTPEGEERTKGYTWMQTVSGSFGVLAYAIGAFWNNFALIYFSVFLVLAFSVIPNLFITEPKELKSELHPELEQSKMGFLAGLKVIQPLWGFLIYGMYALFARLADIRFEHYYIEIVCFLLTLFFVAKTLLTKEQHDNNVTEHLGFQKVLAAHSFTWVGIQSMFIYMTPFVRFNQPEIDDNALGSVVGYSFMIFNAIAAILPVLLLQPLSARFGAVKTHGWCIASMAVGYFAMTFTGANTYGIYLLMALLGVGWSATISLPFAIMSRKVEQSKMGLYMGLFNLSVVLPQLVASLGVGLIVGNAEDKNVLFIICAVCLAISAVCWLGVKEEKLTAVESGSGH